MKLVLNVKICDIIWMLRATFTNVGGSIEKNADELSKEAKMPKQDRLPVTRWLSAFFNRRKQPVIIFTQ